MYYNTKESGRRIQEARLRKAYTNLLVESPLFVGCNTGCVE